MQRIVGILFLVLLVSASGSSSLNKRKFDKSPESVDMSLDNLNGIGSSISRILVSEADTEIKNIDVCDKFDTEVLIRFYEGALEGKDQLKEVLMTHIKTKSDEEIIDALFHTYLNLYTQSYLAIIESIQSRLQQVVGILEGSDDFPVEFIQDLKQFCTQFGNDDDYVFINHFDANISRRPFLDISEFIHLDPHLRLPAAVRKVLDIPVADHQVTSKFIKNNVLSNNFDLWTILVIYEIEMMDGLHLHDTKGVIENYLKRVLLFETNNEMAKLAHQMHINSYFNALKIIIDEKFSYESPLKNPFWFQDLFSLFKYASENYFPGAFQLKVMQLAKPCAIRHYVSKMGLTSANF